MDLRADFLIIGSGIAGLRAAVELADAGSVLILTKADPRDGNTGNAQGGIAAAVGRRRFAGAARGRHARRRRRPVRSAAVRACSSTRARRYVRELMAWGARFDLEPDGSPALAMEGAHSARRVLHARDATGREIGRALWLRASSARRRSDHRSRARRRARHRRRAAGAPVRRRARPHEDGTPSIVRAGPVLLATGGAGHVFSDTTNPPVATGDGIAMAYRAGAAVSDLEFVQFHPTALRVAGAAEIPAVGSAARRGREAGQRGRRGIHVALRARRRSRAARSRRARDRAGIAAHRRAGLSVAGAPRSGVRARSVSVDLAKPAGRPASISRATRSPSGRRRTIVMGGVQDRSRRADVDRWPVRRRRGRVHRRARRQPAREQLAARRTRVRRARRPRDAGRRCRAFAEQQRVSAAFSADRRSQAVLAIVMLPRGDSAADVARRRTVPQSRRAADGARAPRAGVAGDGCSLALGRFLDADGWRAASLLTVGRLIARAALRREESRGGHYREDFPSATIYTGSAASANLLLDPPRYGNRGRTRRKAWHGQSAN